MRCTFIFGRRYNDIAKYGFFAVEKQGPSGSESSGKNDSGSDKTTDLAGYVQSLPFTYLFFLNILQRFFYYALENHPLHSFLRSAMIAIAEQVYSILLLSFFFLEVKYILSLSCLNQPLIPPYD